MKKVLVAILMTLTLATGARALDLIDSKGKVIGPIVETGWDDWQMRVAFHQGFATFLLAFNRVGMTTVYELEYTELNCTGQFGIPTDDNEQAESILWQAAMAPDGTIYMSKKGLPPFPAVVKSSYDSYSKQCINGPIFPERLLSQVMPVGKLNFTPPFAVRTPAHKVR